MENKDFIPVFVFVFVGIILFPVISGMISAITSARDLTTYETLNYSFSDNTGDVPDNWENQTEPLISDYITNAWNTGGYVTVTRTDNSDNYENGVWFQRLTLASVHRGVDSATVSFKYRVIDNENVGSMSVVVWLDSGAGSENFVLYNENVTADESASWISVENTVTDNIAGVGTYAIWLRAELNAVNNYGEGASAILGWDDARLSVSVYDLRYSGTWLALMDLIPLFYVLGLVFVSLAFAIKAMKD